MAKQAEPQVEWVKAWLVRDDPGTSFYVLFFEEAPVAKDGVWTGMGLELAMCPKKFEAQSLHRLEPGGGPVEVEVAIRVRKDD